MATMYCCHCRKDVNTRVEDRMEDFYVGKRRVHVRIPTKVRVCCNCGLDLVDEVLETDNLTRAYKAAGFK